MRHSIYNPFLITLIFIVINSCVKKSVDQRNQINFYNSAKEIEDKIERMNTLLAKVPSDNVSNYFFDAQDNLYINNSNIGKPEKIMLDTVSHLEGLSSKEKKEFKEIAIFLKINKISGCRLDGLFDTWVYDYDQMKDNSFSNFRGIFRQVATTPIQDITQSYEILDQEGNLVLFRGIKNY